jgi:hypothetical protein
LGVTLVPKEQSRDLFTLDINFVDAGLPEPVVGPTPVFNNAVEDLIARVLTDATASSKSDHHDCEKPC